MRGRDRARRAGCRAIPLRGLRGLRAPCALVPALVLAPALTLMACSNDPPIEDVQKPPAPDLQPLLAAYAAPTAALTADAVVGLLLGLADQVAAVDALQLDQRLIEAARNGLMQAQLASAGATAAAAASPPPPPAAAGVAASAQALTVRGSGYLVVTRICDGWGVLPVPDFVNGYMQLNVGFSEQGVDPVLWGMLSDCRYRFGERMVQIDGAGADPRVGDVRAFIGRNVAFETFGSFPDPVVVDVAAQVFVDGRELAGRISFRIDVRTRALEVLVPLGEGHAIAAISPDRQSVIQLRALNGTFVCDLATARCTAPTGETIGAP